MSEIANLEALEILDSRGNPTLAVTVTLANGVKATAKVPSGASPASVKLSSCATVTRLAMEEKVC